MPRSFWKKEMDLITETYRGLNAELHRRNHRYGIGGSQHWRKIVPLLKVYKIKTILDYGCGKGTLSKVIHCTNYDPCVPEFNHEPVPHDLVVCTDVLEHIEPELLENVLTHIHSLTLKLGYFSIANRRDKSKNLPDGSNPHRIIESAEWWEERLKPYFTISRIPTTREQELLIKVKPCQ